MELSQESANVRLNSPRNLATRFGNPANSLASKSPIPSRTTPNQTPPTQVAFKTEEKVAVIEVSEVNLETLEAQEEAQEARQSSVTILRAEKPGAKPGSTRLPEILKANIALSAKLGDETIKEIAERFDVSEDTVSRIKKEKDAELDPVVNRVKDVALNKLMSAMGLITEEAMSKLKPRELSGISKDMAIVVEKVTPRNEQQQNVNLIVYAPSVKSESAYRTVEAHVEEF